MTTEEFLILFCQKADIEFESVYDEGFKEGWLEEEDLIFKNRAISRKNVARICHMYLLKVKKMKDMDIAGAKELKDLYDCRACANHVAQVYMRGIMDAKELKKDGGFLWFDLNGEDDENKNALFIERLLAI